LRIKIILMILAAAILAIPELTAASAGSSSFIFLRIGSGSRPAALSEAVTASGVDISSSFYNPALLRSFEGNNQAVFMYNSYFQDVSQNYLSLAAKGKRYSLGGYLWLGKVGDIERRTNPSANPDGLFDENHFVGSFGFAYDFDYLDFGLSLKYAYEKIDYSSANAVMIDAGIYAPLTDELSIGAAMKNLGTEPKFESESFPLAKEYRLGLSYKPMYLNQMVEILTDAVFYSDTDSKINFGAEYTYNRYFSLRTGYGIGWDSRGVSVGGGVFYNQFKFDYAFVNYKNDLGNTHRFTLVAGF